MSANLVIAGVPLTVVIMTLVEIAKRAGLPRRLAPVLSVGMGVGIMLLAHVIAILPWLREWSDAAAQGVLIGLAACGVYSASKAMVVRNARGRLLELPQGDVVERTATPKPPGAGGHSS